MKVSINDPNAVEYIGRHGICSKKIKALITGIAKMPWGLAFVGHTEDGTAWCSRYPYIVDEEEEADLISEPPLEHDVDNFHVHVYKISGMAEVCVAAPNEEKARQMVLDMAARSDATEFGDSDNQFIAIAFPTESQKKPDPKLRPITEN